MKSWTKQKRDGQSRNEKTKTNNRSNFLLAVIFLLAGGLLYKLFYLQILQKDFYVSLAAGQHEVFRQLEPNRGRIFVEDVADNGGKELFPIATNKDYALVYAKPVEIPISRAESMAKIFYDTFDRAKDQNEVESELKQIRKEKEEKKETIDEEYFNIKREAELKDREEKGLAVYLKLLSKGNDPYEPVKKKVDEEDLKKLYAVLAQAEGQSFTSDEMEVKGNKIYLLRDNKETEITLAGLGFTAETYRYYPEGNIGAQVAGFVGYEGDKKSGRYGLEEYFDDELAGKTGSLKTERDAAGDLIIINDRKYTKPVDGADLILTLDRNIQFAACEKLNAAVQRHGADGGSVIVLEPKSGAVLAMCSSPDFDPNNYTEVKNPAVYNNSGIFEQYEPGSIYKTITMAIALDQGKITPDTTFNDTGVVKIANYDIKNSDLKAHGVCTMTKVLEQSLNTGAIFAMRQVGPEIFADYVKKFGFGEKTGIELEGESKGDIRNLFAKENRDLYASTGSFGQGLSATPMQLVAAYGAIANGGTLMKPYIVKEVVQSDGTRVTAQPKALRQIISSRASTLLGGMLVNVVENGHGKAAGVKGYWVGGKTGTAQVPRKDGRGYEGNSHVGSFAGFAPVDDPKFVMIVKIDHPRDVEWAESSAAPLFGEIADYILHYYKVPTEREVK